MPKSHRPKRRDKTVSSRRVGQCELGINVAVHYLSSIQGYYLLCLHSPLLVFPLSSVTCLSLLLTRTAGNSRLESLKNSHSIAYKFPKIPAATEASNTSSIRIDLTKLTCIGGIGLHYNVYIRTHGLVKAKGTVYFVKARIS